MCLDASWIMKPQLGCGLGRTEAQERQAGLDQQADAEQLRGLHRGHRGHRRQHVHAG